MRRLILVTVLVTVLLVAFAGSALADGPHGYYPKHQGYGGYNTGYGGHNMGYGGYQKTHYPTYNYCCVYVYYPCPMPYYGYQQNYGYGGYGSYTGGYGTMNYGYNAGYGY